MRSVPPFREACRPSTGVALRASTWMPPIRLAWRESGAVALSVAVRMPPMRVVCVVMQPMGYTILMPVSSV